MAEANERFVLRVFNSTGEKELMFVCMDEYPPQEVKRFAEHCKAKGYKVEFDWIQEKDPNEDK